PILVRAGDGVQITVDAGKEVVHQPGAHNVIPTHPRDITSVPRERHVGKEAGQTGKSAGAGISIRPVPAEVSGDPIVPADCMIAFNAELIDRSDRRTLGDKVIAGHILARSWRRAVVWSKSAVSSQQTHRQGIEARFRNLVAGELSTATDSSGIGRETVGIV